MQACRRRFPAKDSHRPDTTVSLTGTSLCTYAVEPPCTERYARWCERSGLIQPLLLDCVLSCNHYSLGEIFPVQRLTAAITIRLILSIHCVPASWADRIGEQLWAIRVAPHRGYPHWRPIALRVTVLAIRLFFFAHNHTALFILFNDKIIAV